ncbi:hypothetical protein UA08_08519 [Talaromyces atroroseus]|uniref:Uncharacterized protein n=1 Tax=Talaromyces atroroseus TaxID=1441469 RepID=A0A1Q5Q7R0_TALAT|nr:hypothetical protein UA08_08519 [Talaromyces atroroseus]OKL56247.1 hypothetical protein UA08_08519 [Talaromyces atroroseus]
MGHRRPQLTIPLGRFQLNVHSQLQSPLFARVPAEIRLIIYSYAIIDYELTRMDPPRYLSTCPCYSLQRHTDTGLLRTCKRILQETWFMPFEVAEHRVCNTHTSPVPAGFGYSTILQQCVNAQNGLSIPRIQKLRYLLRKPDGFEMLQKLLKSTNIFGPKCVVIEVSFFATLSTNSTRYDPNVRLCTEWANELVFPVSVTTIKAEMYGSKNDMDGIVTSVLRKWRFRRVDGAIFKISNVERVAREWETLATRDYDICPPTAFAWFIKTVTWEPVVRFGSLRKGLGNANLTHPQQSG